MKKEYLEVQAKLNTERDRIKECDVQISSMIRNQNELKTKHTDKVVEIKKLENEVSVFTPNSVSESNFPRVHP